MKPYFDDGQVAIYHGDCRDVLPLITADVLVTDPPYGMDLGKHGGAKDKRGRELKRQAYASYDDTAANYQSVVAVAIRLALGIVKRGAVFGPAPSVWHLPPPAALGGVYVRAANGRSPWGFQNLAPVLFYGTAPDLHLGAKHTMLMSNGLPTEPNGHPCPKPLDWMTWLVGLCVKPGETVIDPFMGSGTTLRACKDLGIRAVGIEREERYCEIAARRLSQQVLFTAEATSI